MQERSWSLDRRVDQESWFSSRFIRVAIVGGGIGVLICAAAVIDAFVQWKTHGVACGNLFHESPQPLQYDMYHLTPGGPYDPATSMVTRCSNVRLAQQLVTLAVSLAGLGLLGASLAVIVASTVQRIAGF
jgi:hypothetical protein